jgi:phage virion morphogenesis protein
MSGELYAVWEDAEARRWLNRIQRWTRDLTPFMRQIGERLMVSTSRRFETGRDPRGRAWQKVGDFAPSKRRGGTPLSGRHLAQPGRGYAYQAQHDRLLMGTRLRYGLIHHFGTVGAGGSMPDLVPKTAKMLTIPYPGVTRTARSYSDTFIRKGTIFQAVRRRGKWKPKPLFLLRPSVALPPRPYFGVSAEDWQYIRDLFKQAALNGT